MDHPGPQKHIVNNPETQLLYYFITLRNMVNGAWFNL